MGDEIEALLRAETLLVLAATPAEAAQAHATLIARACRLGRPPLVAVLTDGAPPGPGADAEARRQADAVLRAMAEFGVPEHRVALLGLHAGTAPVEGRLFDRVAEGVRLLMWSRDCGVICAAASGDADAQAAAALAARVVATSGVGWLRWRPGEGYASA